MANRNSLIRDTSEMAIDDEGITQRIVDIRNIRQWGKEVLNGMKNKKLQIRKETNESNLNIYVRDDIKII